MKKVLFILLYVVSTASIAQTFPIAWADLTNMTVNGDNSLTRTGSGSWDAAATSYNRLNPNENGWIQFTVNNLSHTYMVGLATYNGEATYTSLNYAVYLAGAGSYAYELGTNAQNFGSVTNGAVFRITRTGTSLTYSLNGTVVRTVTVSAALPLRVDISATAGSIPVVTASFDKKLLVKPTFTFPTNTNNNGVISLAVAGGNTPYNYAWSSGETTAAISNKARGVYSVTTTDANARTAAKTYNLGYPVGWVDVVNSTINADNTLTKQVTASAWDASAASSNVLAASTNGWMEFVINTSGNVFVAGLNRVNRKIDQYDIAYGFYITNQGIIYILENGTSAGVFGYLIEGDVLRIARESTNSIVYYINGVAVRTVANVTDALLVDASVLIGTVPQINVSFDRKVVVRPVLTYPSETTNTGGAINLNASGGNAPYTFSWSSSETTPGISNKARGLYSVTITDAYGRTFAGSYNLGYPIRWTDVRNGIINPDNSITKINGTGWDGGGLSGNQLAASTDGWAEWVLINPDINQFFGLAKFNADAGYNLIDYEFYFTSAGVVASRLLGGTEIVHGYSAVGDVFRIDRTAGQIRFLRNGIVLRSVAAITNPLHVDFSMTTGVTPVSVSTSFAQKPQQTFYAITDGNWNVPATWSLTEGGAAATTFPLTNDIVYVKGKGVNVISTKVMCAGVNVIATNSTTLLKIDGINACLTVRGEVKVSGLGNTDATKALAVQNEAKLVCQ